MRRLFPNTHEGWAQVFFGLMAVGLLVLGLKHLNTHNDTDTTALPDKFDVVGKARVHDGDSVTIGKTKVRLWGIDAPELQQSCKGREGDVPCGTQSRDALREIINDQSLSCVQKDTSYDRVVAQCYAGQVDIAQAVIKRGYAISEWYHSKAPYQADERLAKAGLVGIWDSQFVKPSQWRMCNLPQNKDKRPRNCDKAFHTPKGL